MALILGDSIRDDDGIIRFFVSLPDIDTGFHGVQIKLPTSEKGIMDAIKAVHLQLQNQLTASQALKTKYANIIDKNITLA